MIFILERLSGDDHRCSPLRRILCTIIGLGIDGASVFDPEMA